jgi:hypothetical protein
LIISFSTFSCKAKFLCFFHSIEVCMSLHSPSKNFDIFPWRIYATSIATLFWPPCQNPIFPPSWHWRKVTMSSFGLRHWSSPYDVILNFITCARIIVTLFHVSNVFQVIIY